MTTIGEIMQRDAEKKQRSLIKTISEIMNQSPEKTPEHEIERCNRRIAEIKSTLEQLNGKNYGDMSVSDRGRHSSLHDEWSLLIEQKSEAAKMRQREQAIVDQANLRKSQPKNALADAIKTRDILRGDMNQVLTGAVKLGEADRRRLANAVSVAEDHVRACEL